MATRRELRQKLGGAPYCGDLILSSALSGSDSTRIIDTTQVQPNDTLNYGQIVVIGGGASGDRRRVADWAQSGGIITPDRNFTAAVSSGDAYELHRLFDADDKDACINEAIQLSADNWLIQNENQTITVYDDSTAYGLSAIVPAIDRGLKIDDIFLQPDIDDSLSTEWSRVDPNTWYLRENSVGNQTLQFTISPDDSVKIRLHYRTRPQTLSADTSTLYPDDVAFVEYIATRAAGLLFQKKAHLSEEGNRDHWQMMADRFEQKAEGLLTRGQYVQTHKRPTRSGW